MAHNYFELVFFVVVVTAAASFATTFRRRVQQMRRWISAIKIPSKRSFNSRVLVFRFIDGVFRRGTTRRQVVRGTSLVEVRIRFGRICDPNVVQFLHDYIGGFFRTGHVRNAHNLDVATGKVIGTGNALDHFPQPFPGVFGLLLTEVRELFVFIQRFRFYVLAVSDQYDVPRYAFLKLVTLHNKRKRMRNSGS